MITIKAVIDVLGALEAETLDGNLYLFDNNRRGGSRGQGSTRLATAVKRGDEIVWTIAPLECEAYAEIAAISLPPAICEVEKQTYSGTNVSYWIGTIKKAVDELPYSLTLSLGHSGLSMTWENGPRLIKAATENRAPNAQ